jgi:hypothetical protein
MAQQRATLSVIDGVNLAQAAEVWIQPYRQARHLVRTRDWVLELAPGAGEPLVLAALTHDIERHFPGGPQQDKANAAWDDPAYLTAHSERSAAIVEEWLRSQGADPELVRSVGELILLHEVGGSAAADLLQAADSVSFLETLSDVAVSWVRTGQCTADKAREKHGWMLERIRVERARRLAMPFYERAIAAIDEELERLAGRAT